MNKIKISVLASILILGTITAFQDVDAETFPESFIEVQKLTALDAESGKGFGYQVDIDGNTAVISEVANNAGGVHVFDFDTTTKTWNEIAKLTTVPEINTDNFGRAVAISGDTIIVGAQNDHEGGQFAGAAYVFERDTSNTWPQVAKLIASDAFHDSHFGGDGSIDIDGNIAIIGAFADDGDCPADDPATGINEHDCNAGAAYIFEKNESTGIWEEKQKLTRNLPDRGFFGLSTSIDGDTAVIGGSFADSLSGGAFVFQRDTTTNTWSQQAELFPLNPLDNGFFGRIVAHFENTALVYAPSGNSGSGSILVFEKDSANNWSETQQMIPSDGTFSFSRLGISIIGDTTVLSSGIENAAYVFELDATNIWNEKQKIVTSDNNAGSFGGSLAMSGDTIIVGANTSADPTLGQEFVGAVYVFNLGETISENVEGNLDVNNEVLRIAEGVTINGDVKVQDGTLFVDGGTINGDVVIKKNSRVELGNTVIDGDLDAKKCGTLAFTDNVITGNLDVKDCNDVFVLGSLIDGNAKISKNENLKFNVNTISGDLEIKKNQSCIASKNNASGDSQVKGCVENTPPTIDTVEVTSFFPSTFANLSCTVIGANDIDDDSITFSFDWFINGVFVTTADVLSSSFTEVDDEVFCEATPFDGTDSGIPVASNIITIIGFGGGGGI